MAPRSQNPDSASPGALAAATDGNDAAGESVVTSPSNRRYSAIAACVREARAPTHEELKKVASRIWREGFAARGSTSSFTARRIALIAAKAALEGTAPGDAAHPATKP